MSSWVYVLTNKGAPGLVKIGFTDRTPDLRAQELGATGLPFPYVVAFAIQVYDGRRVERQVHASLQGHHVGKEWFRCSSAFAQRAIEEMAGSGASSSPLVPGHALEHLFSEALQTGRIHRAGQSTPNNEESDDCPYPPGHPLRGLL